MDKFKVGDRVKLSQLGMAEYCDSVSNPYNIEGTIYHIADSLVFSSRVVRVHWDNDKLNIYNLEELELVQKQNTNPFVIETKTYKLNRNYITSPSRKITISGGSEVFVISSGNTYSVADIPEIIQHLQNFYNAVELEKG